MHLKTASSFVWKDTSVLSRGYPDEIEGYKKVARFVLSLDTPTLNERTSILFIFGFS